MFLNIIGMPPDPSVVSLPGLALMKTVLESMRTLSYFRLDTYTVVSCRQNLYAGLLRDRGL